MIPEPCFVKQCDQVGAREIEWRNLGMVDTYCTFHADELLETYPESVKDVTKGDHS